MAKNFGCYARKGQRPYYK